jgi:hypothetical protein
VVTEDGIVMIGGVAVGELVIQDSDDDDDDDDDDHSDDDGDAEVEEVEAVSLGDSDDDDDDEGIPAEEEAQIARIAQQLLLEQRLADLGRAQSLRMGEMSLEETMVLMTGLSRLSQVRGGLGIVATLPAEGRSGTGACE